MNIYIFCYLEAFSSLDALDSGCSSVVYIRFDISNAIQELELSLTLGCVQVLLEANRFVYHAVPLRCVPCQVGSVCKRVLLESKPKRDLPVRYALHQTFVCDTLHTNGAWSGFACRRPSRYGTVRSGSLWTT